jgi:hypothetical protein
LLPTVSVVPRCVKIRRYAQILFLAVCHMSNRHGMLFLGLGRSQSLSVATQVTLQVTPAQATPRSSKCSPLISINITNMRASAGGFPIRVHVFHYQPRYAAQVTIYFRTVEADNFDNPSRSAQHTPTVITLSIRDLLTVWFFPIPRQPMISARQANANNKSYRAFAMPRQQTLKVFL